MVSILDELLHGQGTFERVRPPCGAFPHEHNCVCEMHDTTGLTDAEIDACRADPNMNCQWTGKCVYTDSAQEKVQGDPNRRFEEFHYAQRKDKSCIARPGKIQVTALMGRTHYDVPGDPITKMADLYTFKGKTITKVLETCDPKLTREKGRNHDVELQFKIQQYFRDDIRKNPRGMSCNTDETTDNFHRFQPCFLAVGYPLLDNRDGEFDHDDDDDLAYADINATANFRWDCLKDYNHDRNIMQNIFEGGDARVPSGCKKRGSGDAPEGRNTISCFSTGNWPAASTHGFDSALGRGAMPYFGSGSDWYRSAEVFQQEIQAIGLPMGGWMNDLGHMVDCPYEKVGDFKVKERK